MLQSGGRIKTTVNSRTALFDARFRWLLRNRSPIIVGWRLGRRRVHVALKHRMKEGLKFSLYWFCYKASIGDVPLFCGQS
jgi:hypothetical protein